jgi:hypothetical protein
MALLNAATLIPDLFLFLKSSRRGERKMKNTAKVLKEKECMCLGVLIEYVSI